MTSPFRPMRDDEADQVIALWTACDLTRPWNPPEADIALARGNPNAEIFVAEQGGGIIAAFMVGHDAHRAWVYYLAVSPDHRREGWGERAMTAAEDWGRAQGMPKINRPRRRRHDGSDSGRCSVLARPFGASNHAGAMRVPSRHGAKDSCRSDAVAQYLDDGPRLWRSLCGCSVDHSQSTTNGGDLPDGGGAHPVLQHPPRRSASRTDATPATHRF